MSGYLQEITADRSGTACDGSRISPDAFDDRSSDRYQTRDESQLSLPIAPKSHCQRQGSLNRARNTRLDKDIMQTKPKVIPAPAGSETNRNHVPGEVALAAVDGVLLIAHPQCK